MHMVSSLRLDLIIRGMPYDETHNWAQLPASLGLPQNSTFRGDARTGGA
jgi:hypothetical protein